MATVSTTTLANTAMVSEVLSGVITEALYDNTSIRGLALKVPTNFGSLTTGIFKDSAPEAFASLAEGSSITTSAYGVDSFDLVLAQYSKAYAINDLVGVAGSPVDMERIKGKLVKGVDLTLTDLMCASFTSFTATAGSAIATFSINGLFDAVGVLNMAGVDGDIVAVLHPAQVNELRTALRSATGAFSFMPATHEQIEKNGQGFQGNFGGIEIWQSDSVSSAASTYTGIVMAKDAIAYQMGDMGPVAASIPAGSVLVNSPELVVELSRDGMKGESTAVAHSAMAVAIADQSRGCMLVSLVS